MNDIIQNVERGLLPKKLHENFYSCLPVICNYFFVRTCYKEIVHAFN